MFMRGFRLQMFSQWDRNIVETVTPSCWDATENKELGPGRQASQQFHAPPPELNSLRLGELRSLPTEASRRQMLGHVDSSVTPFNPPSSALYGDSGSDN